MSFLVYSSVGILTLISFIHFYWLFGGKRGFIASVPEKVEGDLLFTPKIIETLIVALGLLFVGFMLLVQFDAIPFLKPTILTKTFCILFTCVFFLRAVGDFKYLGFFKRIKHSIFAKYDTKYYSPLCLYLGLSLLLVLF
ncbi:DUF3995 domain-containing protein [Evansella tamaricis]|uniref:DUF3995 domain-containing protein n=1 Tax=Evansella tamaricis TaxID=2069301 RepID=A0ABS6JDU9_9BACI|nr:DUF3995 domain-containing protein [Evansella tamaricis]MBU9711850.1 DUF3995 domain-containing protein [Evansella tamaricis]